MNKENLIDKAIKRIEEFEKSRVKALQNNIKMGCENCSQFDEIFGCSKCKSTMNI